MPRVTSVSVDESGLRQAALEGSAASAVILRYVPWVLRMQGDQVGQ